MREYGFPLTRILPYKNKIEDIRENTGQWKPVFSHILCSAAYLIWSRFRMMSYHLKNWIKLLINRSPYLSWEPKRYWKSKIENIGVNTSDKKIWKTTYANPQYCLLAKQTVKVEAYKSSSDLPTILWWQ